jgi:hypothetical protein
MDSDVAGFRRLECHRLPRDSKCSMTDVGWMDATAQAALMREGKASPLELLDVALARLDAVNPQLNAVIHLLADRAQLVLTRSVRDTAGVLGLVEQGQLITRAVDGWFALTGQPAISLPIHWTDDGLPMGVQLVAFADGVFVRSRDRGWWCPWGQGLAPDPTMIFPYQSVNSTPSSSSALPAIPSRP